MLSDLHDDVIVWDHYRVRLFLYLWAGYNRGMDHIRLIILRGKLLALENGFAVGLYDAAWVRNEARELQAMGQPPEPERQRIAVLLQAVDGPVLPA